MVNSQAFRGSKRVASIRAWMQKDYKRSDIRVDSATGRTNNAESVRVSVMLG